MTLDFIFKKCTGKTCQELSEASELDWFEGYADPREDSGKGILVANWNHFPRLAANGWDNRDSESREAAQQFNWSRKGRRFQDILERLGYKLEWSDCISRCDDCNKAIQTEPTSYCWQPEYHTFDGYILCKECILSDPADYLSNCENEPNKAVFDWIDPTEHGYTLIQDKLESGLHPGQNDNPQKIYRDLQEKGYDGILFKVDSTGQFDIRFSVYYREAPETPESPKCDDCGAEMSSSQYRLCDDCYKAESEDSAESE